MSASSYGVSLPGEGDPKQLLATLHLYLFCFASMQQLPSLVPPAARVSTTPLRTSPPPTTARPAAAAVAASASCANIRGNRAPIMFADLKLNAVMYLEIGKVLAHY